MCGLNLALAHKGQLSERLLDYPQHGIETLMLHWDRSTARDLIEYNGKTYIRMYSGKSLNEAGRKWTGNDKRLYYPIPTSQITLSASHGSLLKQNPGWE